jgi:radical SAM superfamily enzyme YgiQ (UPF0313 family)
VGGPHPTVAPEMIAHPGIDIICRGEGELAMLDLADALEMGRDITRIRNLHVKTRGGVVHRNEPRPVVPLDELPPPNRELYYGYRFLRDAPLKRFISSPDGHRRKSVTRLLSEITHIKRRYPLKRVHFSDDAAGFCRDAAWLEEFAERYRPVVGRPFSCELGQGLVDESIAGVLARAGCHRAIIGAGATRESWYHLRRKGIRVRVYEPCGARY